MSNKLLKIDDANRCDHCRLEATDQCYYFGEYTAYRGFDHSATNGLISNLKKSVDRRGKPEWQYKELALERAGFMLGGMLANASAVLVPIPPSKARFDPLYDDRMLRILQKASSHAPNCHVSELVIQRQSTLAVHTTTSRPSVQELIDNYQVDASEFARVREAKDIIIIDDVLTTGAHFKAMQAVISGSLPAVNIYGIFIARRVPEPIQFPDLDAFDVL